MVRRRSYSHAFRRDELAADPQDIPGHRLSDYQLPTGSHSEIPSVESKFEDRKAADVTAVDDPRSFLHRSKTGLSATD
jgi:hypothetical protein